MGLKFDTKKFAEKDAFTYIGRVLKFREQDAPLEHKTNTLHIDSDVEIMQLVIDVEGISVEWIGDEGNVRSFTADEMTKEGAWKSGRNHKAYYILSAIIAPEDPEEALEAGFVDKEGNPVTGLGYDQNAPDFPECLEGRVFKVEHRWIRFGKNPETGQEMTTMIPVLLEELPQDYVHEGKVAKITYKGRTTAGREAREATGADDGESDPLESLLIVTADPEVFFAAIEGRRLHLADLNEACNADPRLAVEPYRTLIATRLGRQALVDEGFVTVGEDKTITVQEVPTLAALEKLVATVKEAIAAK